jgi:hypothetical protein
MREASADLRSGAPGAARYSVSLLRIQGTGADCSTRYRWAVASAARCTCRSARRRIGVFLTKGSRCRPGFGSSSSSLLCWPSLATLAGDASPGSRPSGPRRPVAPLGDADEGVGEAEVGDDLSRAKKKRGRRRAGPASAENGPRRAVASATVTSVMSAIQRSWMGRVKQKGGLAQGAARSPRNARSSSALRRANVYVSGARGRSRCRHARRVPPGASLAGG